MLKALLCTQNPHKVKEIKEILPTFAWQTLFDIGFNEEIPENGATFEENATQKALFVANRISSPFDLLVADDSGLEVDALNGRPGVHSARYLGNDRDYHKKCQGLLNELQSLPPTKRTARFVCVVAALLPDGTIKTLRATCEGSIAYEERGTNGFGFDPIFLPSEYGGKHTMAELSSEEKNAVSHRGKAFRMLQEWLKEEGKYHGIL